MSLGEKANKWGRVARKYERGLEYKEPKIQAQLETQAEEEIGMAMTRRPSYRVLAPRDQPKGVIVFRTDEPLLDARLLAGTPTGLERRVRSNSGPDLVHDEVTQMFSTYEQGPYESPHHTPFMRPY
ncbi:MAG: hypothetical protein ACMXYF_03195 [Candidatus Woesearchaeota archaeon]